MPSSSPVLTQALCAGARLGLAGGAAKAAALAAAREPARASTDKRCARVIGRSRHYADLSPARQGLRRWMRGTAALSANTTWCAPGSSNDECEEGVMRTRLNGRRPRLELAGAF